MGIVDQGAIGFSSRTAFTVQGSLRSKSGGHRARIIAVQLGDVGGGTTGTRRTRKQRIDIDGTFLAGVRV